jgi:hypothetical protein
VLLHHENKQNFTLLSFVFGISDFWFYQYITSSIRFWNALLLQTMDIFHDPWHGIIRIEEGSNIFYPKIEKGISIIALQALPEQPIIDVCEVFIIEHQTCPPL